MFTILVSVVESKIPRKDGYWSCDKPNDQRRAPL